MATAHSSTWLTCSVSVITWVKLMVSDSPGAGSVEDCDRLFRDFEHHRWDRSAEGNIAGSGRFSAGSEFPGRHVYGADRDLYQADWLGRFSLGMVGGIFAIVGMIVERFFLDSLNISGLVGERGH